MSKVDQLKRAVADTKREKWPVKRGDIVAVIIEHSSTGAIGSGVKGSRYSEFHLAVARKVTRLGRAEMVQLVGSTQDRKAYDWQTRTLAITAQQDAAKRLAATFDHPGANCFASGDHLKTAILAHDKAEVA